MSVKVESYTETYSYSAYTLGEERLVYNSTYGWQTMRFVQNGHASTAGLVGELFLSEGGAQNRFIGTPGTANAKRISALGIIQAASLAAQYYGWVQMKGRGSFRGDGSVVAGNLVYSAATAVLSATAGTGEALGIAEADDTGSPVVFDGFIDCP